MKLYFENSLGEAFRYELPRSFKPDFSPYKRRKNFKPRYGQDGSVQTADGKVSSRQISFNYFLASGDVDQIVAGGGDVGDNAQQTKDNAYRQSILDLLDVFREGLEPFYLIDTDGNLGDGLRTQVDLLEHVDKPHSDGLIQRIGANSFVLEMIKGHWEDIDATIDNDSGTITSGDTILIDNTGPLKVFPIFRITALNNVEELTLTNDANGHSFTYANTAFGSGSTLVIDATGADFDVLLDDVNSAYALEDGSGPIELEPGENLLTFESPSGIVAIEIEYRRKFPI